MKVQVKVEIEIKRSKSECKIQMKLNFLISNPDSKDSLPPVRACVPPLLVGVTCRLLDSHVSETMQASLHPAVMPQCARRWYGLPPEGPAFSHKPVKRGEF